MPEQPAVRRHRDDPHGLEFRGRERGLPFIRPYRRIGELNQVELWKLDRHPFEAVRDVVDRYSKEGAAAIATVPGEPERLKWAGIYPQRQGGDAFMMRIKVTGGFLTAEQAREIGSVADSFAVGPEESRVFGNRYADLTTRQDVQIHWVRIEDIPRIWERFADVGLTTLQACGDGSRNVTCCPVSGVDAEEAFDAMPIARAISDFFTGNRDYANLPRKFKMSATGCLENCARAEINDISLWPARADDGTLGFNLLVGGGLSDGERMASDIDVYVAQERAVEVCRGIAQVFGELGNRENRGLSRMRYLVEELGPEGFRTELQRRVRFELPPAGEELTRRFRGDHVGVHAQRQPGLFYVGCCVPVGRMQGRDLMEAARLAETYGDGTLRIGTDQNFMLTGVPEDRLDALLAEPLLERFSPDPGPFTRGVMACTGSEFCRFAVVETKERAVKWARALDAALDGTPAANGAEGPNGRTGGDAEHAHGVGVNGAGDRRSGGGRNDRGSGDGRTDRGIIRLHFSGCSASCAQPQVADVGFRGEVARTGDHLSEAVDIGLGGSLGPDAAFIDWVTGRLPVDDVPEALGRLLSRYQAERRADEPLYAWARRTPNEELRDLLEDRVPVTISTGRGHGAPAAQEAAGESDRSGAGAGAGSESGSPRTPLESR